MQKHAVKLIVNPNADFGRAWRWASDLRPIVEEFGGADWSGTVYPTYATQLARQAAEEGYRLIIAAGGDGTVHEVINGLMQVPLEQRPRLGIVPLGSGNEFSHALGMDRRSAYALRQIFTGTPRRIDIGSLRDEHGLCEYWENVLGIGFDATGGWRFPQVRMGQLRTLDLESDRPLNIHTDGEIFAGFGMDVRRLSVEILPGAIEVVV